jgi:acetylornithine deacetylase/succinyl-diaminopimelate desuccinylase-like protein
MMDASATLASSEQAAIARLDDAEAFDLVRGMVDIPSPTGEEAPLAAFCAEWLVEHGVAASVQHLDESQANTVAEHAPAGGSGRSLLLYAPLDTVTVGTHDEDVPGVGDVLRPDLECIARVDGRRISGLGASNPKGHGAAVMLAASAIARSGVPLDGVLRVGLGAGGMPTNSRPGQTRRNVGQGVGCAFMLEQSARPDAAIISKPGWAVAWEEVGLLWFEIDVRGTYNYVGSRHRIPYTNAILAAGRLAQHLDEWFLTYSARHRSGLVEPQGQIGWIEGGWERMPAFTPAVCRMRVDLRISPRSEPAAIAREFEAAVRTIATDVGIDATAQTILTIPGTSTDPQHDIIRTTIEAWEAETGTRHDELGTHGLTSGATDANILRGHGIPTARIGMERVRDAGGQELDFALGMNTADVDQVIRLARVLVRAALRHCR